MIKRRKLIETWLEEGDERYLSWEEISVDGRQLYF